MATNKIIKVVQEFDEVTGELIREFTTTSKNTEGLEKWRMENLLPTKFKSQSRFTKVYHRELPDFSTRQNLGNFFLLLQHIAPEFNYLGRLTKTDGWIPLSKKDIQDILKVSTNTTYLFLKECQQLKVITKVSLNDKEQEFYMVNPIYGFNGSKISLLLYFVFRSCPKFIKSLSQDELDFINDVQWSNRKLQLEKPTIIS